MAALPERPGQERTDGRSYVVTSRLPSWLAAHAEWVARLVYVFTLVVGGGVALAVAVTVSVAVSGAAGAVVFFLGGLFLLAAVPTLARLAGRLTLASLAARRVPRE